MTYTWEDKKTKKRVDVTRVLDDINHKPDKPEALASGLTIEEYAEAEWQRVLNSPAFTGPKNKGYW